MTLRASIITITAELGFGGPPLLKVRMMLDCGVAGKDSIWRGWEVALPPLPEDPVEAWELVRAAVAALRPVEPNADLSIRDITQRIEPKALVR